MNPKGNSLVAHSTKLDGSKKKDSCC